MPSIIATWQPGHLYQGGDVVIPNEGGAVTQVDPSNPGFESGDVGWTKDPGWTIDMVDAFQGTWSAEFPGESGKLLGFISFDISNRSRVTLNGTGFTTSSPLTSLLMAANDALFVAVNVSTLHTAADGLTWTLETPPAGWSGKTKAFVSHIPAFDLFMCGVASSTEFFTSADGVSWTTHTFPTSFTSSPALNQEAPADNGSTAVIVATNGNAYSSVDGLTWTDRGNLFTSSNGSVVYATALGKFFAVGVETGTDKIFSSVDGITWVEETTSDYDSMNVGTRISWSEPLELFVARGNASGSSAINIATSTDGVDWTLQTSAGFAGVWLRWSETLQAFVSTGDNFLNKSVDGTTWTQATYDASTFEDVPYPSADRLTEDPIRVMVNDTAATVVPGQTLRVRALVKSTADGNGMIGLRWFDDVAMEIKTDLDPTPVSGPSTGWRETLLVAQAPAGADTCSVVCAAQGSGSVRFDNIVWEHFSQEGFCDFTFEVTSIGSGYSGTAEPVWPLTLSGTVVDNEVTWTARLANCITYEAKPILQSGPVEPTFPLEVGASVADNTILWFADDLRVKDPNCPNTKEVAIAASKIFAADVDVVAFSATINPLDWTSANDAGFIPFGLNTYGSNDITALGLYRSNLVVFNTAAFQMWQVDEDPANMAILDAIPIGCPFFKSLSPVSNDLVFLTKAGIRSMGIAGASTNLQAGEFGKQVDPLILAAIKGGEVPDSLFFPGQGQYWLFFGEEAFVLTMNGGKRDMSWSRYVFPSAIDDWTIDGQDLILRSGDKIWRVDEDILIDDSGGANVVFAGEIWWPYLDFGALGQTKEMIGFDTVVEGEYSVSFGYNQNDDSQFTTPYTITDGDTLVGDIIPMPITAPSFQMRLTLTGNTAWEWSASSLYVQDLRRTS